jgi:hypothetical protein
VGQFCTQIKNTDAAAQRIAPVRADLETIFERCGFAIPTSALPFSFRCPILVAPTGRGEPYWLLKSFVE